MSNQNNRQLSFIETARRRQLTLSAIETIAEVGIAKASFVRIAARAGVSPALISYHFENKDDLVRSVITTITTSMDAFIGRRAEVAESYTNALQAVIEESVRFYVSHPSEMRVLKELQLSFRNPADGTSRLAIETRERSIAELEGFLRQGQEDGEFRRFETRPMAVTMLAALEAAANELAIHPETDPQRYARELARSFVLAVQRTAKGASHDIDG